MQVELLGYTQANPALTPEIVAGRSDLGAIPQGHGTFPEQIIEYAGRVCYRSTQRMGTAPEFIAARVREGHEDIIEHAVVTVRIRNSIEPLHWRAVNRHCEVSDVGDSEWIVSGNTHVWLDFFRRGVALEALPILKRIAPKVFAEFDVPDIPDSRLATMVNGTPSVPPSAIDTLLPAEDGPMRVTLLGFTQPLLGDPNLLLDHGAATFFFEGISRTCTHQLVRHRLASFSQESQRYVDLSRGAWSAVVPKAIADHAEARRVMESFWCDAEEKYAQLRQLGIRKEDARFLLPNAAETRIITTMNFAAWSHFLWLRAVDKAAQWEIRAMGQRVLEVLFAIAPEVFQEHWSVYLDRFRGEQSP